MIVGSLWNSDHHGDKEGHLEKESGFNNEVMAVRRDDNFGRFKLYGC